MQRLTAVVMTELMPCCTKTTFLLTPHYICAHRNSDNLRNAVFKGYSLVMADEHLIVVLHQQCELAADSNATGVKAPATHTSSSNWART